MVSLCSLSFRLLTTNLCLCHRDDCSAAHEEIHAEHAVKGSRWHRVCDHWEILQQLSDAVEPGDSHHRRDDDAIGTRHPHLAYGMMCVVTQFLNHLDWQDGIA